MNDIKIEEIVQAHDALLKVYGDGIRTLEDSTLRLEKSIMIESRETLAAHDALLKVHEEKIRTLENNALRLENVVMTENRETRSVVLNANQKLMDLMGTIVGHNTDNSKSKDTATMAKWETIARIATLLLGSGGILYYVFG